MPYVPHRQLALFPVPPRESFDQFIVTNENRPLIHALRFSSDPSMVVYGEPQSGRSHLLKALCAETSFGTARARYFAFSGQGGDQEDSVAAFCDFEASRLICLDDIDCILGDAHWEQTLYFLFEKARQRRVTLVISASAPPAQLGIELPDLRSRLEASAVFRLEPLDDEHKKLLLKQRAAEHGVSLNSEAADYILRHLSRGARDLLSLVDQLSDVVSDANRRVTVPAVQRFIRDLSDLSD